MLVPLLGLAGLCGPVLVNAIVSQLPPIPRDLSTPVQQRLGYNGATGMFVGWNTFKPLTKPTVHYGLTPNLLLFSKSSSASSSVTYNTSRTWANSVELSGLLPATTYYYKIDSTNSSVDSFKTARLPGDPTPFAAALVIDMGVFGPDGLSSANVSATGKAITFPLRPSEHTTIQQLVKSASSYEFVLHPGDLAYADAWLKEETLGYINASLADGPAVYEGLTEQFYDELSAVSRMKPYMVTAGNHEANCLNGGTNGFTEAICPLGQTNFTQFINRFAKVMPTAPSQSILGFRSVQLAARDAAAKLAKPPFWYSFDYGMAHFLMIDTETDLGVGLIGPDERGGEQNDSEGPFGSYKDQQHDFINKDLSSVDRLITPWVVVAGHRPWYVSNGFPCPECQTAFESIFLKYGVDLAVFGHTHNQQLILPVANNVTDPAGWNNPKAPAYIVQGAAGHFEGLEPVLPTPPSYLAWANDTTYGFSKLVFKDRNHLELQFIQSDTGDVMHSQVLYKKHEVRFFA